MLDPLYQHQQMTQNYVNVFKYNFIILMPSTVESYWRGKKNESYTCFKPKGMSKVFYQIWAKFYEMLLLRSFFW